MRRPFSIRPNCRSREAEKIEAFELGLKSQFADRPRHAQHGGLSLFVQQPAVHQYRSARPRADFAQHSALAYPRRRGRADRPRDDRHDHAARRKSGLLDTKIKRGIVSGVDVRGNNLSNAPKFTFTGGIDATVIDGAKRQAQPARRYQLFVEPVFRGAQHSPAARTGYVLLAGHIDRESADGRWNASVWGKNLTNKLLLHLRASTSLCSFGFDCNRVGTPRTYGVTVGAKF